MEERKGSEWSSIGDRALVDGLRAGQTGAVDELIRRFEPLVTRYAQVLRVPPSDRRHWIGEVLYEVATTLSRGRMEPPRHLGAYIAGACNLKVRRLRVAEWKYQRRVGSAAERVDGGEAAVIGLCSEDALRSARDPSGEVQALSPLLQRLVSAFGETVTPEEQRLLEYLANQISYTTIAKWLGITRPAAVSRIQRLRARLVRAALSFGASLNHDDRTELIRFLRRTGTVREEQIAEIEDGDR
jgi:RNase P/RNase MRP subunit POP5